MAATNLVIDTSVFIEHLRAKNKQKTILFTLPDYVKLFASVVTLYELFAGTTTETKSRDVQVITQGITILPVNEDVARQASIICHKLRANNKTAELRDILIAATCIAYDFPLKTTSTKPFNRISSIEFFKA